MYIGNGHAGWEAANANLFSRGDKALVLAVGQFGLSWANSARAMGIEVEVLDFGKSSPADMGRIEAALRADTGHRIKAVLTTHVDTASSIKTDIPALRAAMDAAGHPALLAVDCIASLGCDEFRMDDWGVDVMVAACQKGLMTPPGMAFVWFSRSPSALRQVRPCDALLGLGPKGRARGVLADLGRHRADKPPFRPARGAGHAARRGDAAGLAAPPHAGRRGLGRL
jgi:aspartate aminotransferase-like enzyme